MLQYATCPWSNLYKIPEWNYYIFVIKSSFVNEKCEYFIKSDFLYYISADKGKNIKLRNMTDIEEVKNNLYFNSERHD